MLGTVSLASRPLSAAPLLPRAFRVAIMEGQYGWAAWSYSRQGKLNAWSWHGLGAGSDASVTNWAVLGNTIYMRREADSLVHLMQPDVFLGAGDENTESTSVEATTQWLDFGRPGKRKALTGLDFDGKNVDTVQVYVSAGGDRDGVLAETIDLTDAQGGWTYSGELLPLSCDGTEFKLRFIGDANQEVQVNRLTLHWDEIAG